MELWRIIGQQRKNQRGILIRALDIAIFLIILQATIGFVNSLGMFDYDYYATQNNTYTQYTVQDLEEYETMAQNPGVSDYVSLAVDLAWEGIIIIAKVFFSVVLILPTLVSVFEIPTALAALIQGLVYFVYIIGWAQWKSGKSMEGIV